MATYGKIDGRGWTGLTRINSIECQTNGGNDPSNKAMRMSINKSSRPISANPHHMRASKKGSLAHAQTYQENLRFDGSSKYVGRPQSGYGTTAKQTISTAAVTNPNYNASMMSRQFRSSNRHKRQWMNKTGDNINHSNVNSTHTLQQYSTGSLPQNTFNKGSAGPHHAQAKTLASMAGVTRDLNHPGSIYVNDPTA